MKKESCKNCYFFNEFEGGNTCKRYPPIPFPMTRADALGQPVMSVMCIEPQVLLDNWCGEYHQKEPLLNAVP